MMDTVELRTAVLETENWIDDLMERLSWRDREKTYRVLVAGLHAVRDSLPWGEAVHLGAYLPPLLRGLYYEGWHPTDGALPLRSRSAFLERIHDSIHHDPAIDPEIAARGLFALLAQRLPAAELEDARVLTPRELHGLWPQ
jgi:uncharacterized protein (DUF2267 family)